MAIADAIREIAADLAEVPGIGVTTDAPPEQINERATLVVYAGDCEHKFLTHDDGGDAPSVIGVYEVKARLYIPRINLPDDVTFLTPFMSTIPVALLNGFATDRFNGTVLTMGDATSPGAGTTVSGSLGPGDWEGGGNVVMVAFVMSISIEMPLG